MKKWFTLIALLLVAPFVHADFDEGIHYKRIANPQPTANPDKIEVLELFWYGCPHCYHLEPQLDAWLEGKPDDVAFVRMPAVLGPDWELLARAYYTMELLGVEEQVHRPLFDRIHKQRKRYGITGVPVLVVNGKYLTSAQMAGGNKEMLQVVDFLVEQERTASRSAVAAPAAP